MNNPDRIELRDPDHEAVILVVDEDARAQGAVAGMLRELGHCVETCPNGPRALAFLLRRPTAVRLVLADVGMSRMDGGELAERIQDFAPALPVVLLGNLGDSRSRDVLAGYADFPFLRKPVRLAELAQVVRAYLGGEGEHQSEPVARRSGRHARASGEHRR